MKDSERYIAMDGYMFLKKFPTKMYLDFVVVDESYRLLPLEALIEQRFSKTAGGQI